jgi:hypothetical protein
LLTSNSAGQFRNRKVTTQEAYKVRLTFSYLSKGRKTQLHKEENSVIQGKVFAEIWSVYKE